MEDYETIDTDDVPVWRKPQSELTAVDQMKLGLAGAAIGVGVVLVAHEIGEGWARFSDWRWRRRVFKETNHLEDFIDTTGHEQ